MDHDVSDIVAKIRLSGYEGPIQDVFYVLCILNRGYTIDTPNCFGVDYNVKLPQISNKDLDRLYEYLSEKGNNE